MPLYREGTWSQYFIALPQLANKPSAGKTWTGISRPGYINNPRRFATATRALKGLQNAVRGVDSIRQSRLKETTDAAFVLEFVYDRRGERAVRG
jgi:hypothetical protein